ncbi:Extracellular matrix-binding ebh, putative [Babesia ovata]|uniref:Extracellular matrix-binding ebh, putative n=1 Tax=Babesia ovata TaxID=189622 RepID=A0A2H6KFH6_9APIC|nr:Extracellular matrix-binding ebh, putative [Babesia ovata]GBE61748.1 Extracellular matrix-binding ebh, putative [Babesia ovata]
MPFACDLGHPPLQLSAVILVDHLKTEVENLGKWNSAAKEVITKAEQKCGEILKKVSTTEDSGVIKKQAQELQKKGVELLTAATAAKREVELKVTAALQAVVKMDTDLKKDLKKVKDGIKGGITQVIQKLGVLGLDKKVQEDLQSLKGKIEGLTSNGKVDSLVNNELAALEKAKQTFNEDTKKINTETAELEKKFDKHIQQPLTQAVTAVDQAIGTLGGKFPNGGKLDTIEKIFGHIKDKVGEIKGTPGSLNNRGEWENNTPGSGLEGINTKVTNYFGKFSGRNFQSYIVKGWLEDSILKYNGLLRTKLGWGQLADGEGDHANLGIAISGRLNAQYLEEDNDPTFAKAVKKLKHDDSSMKGKIQYVHDVCKEFAKVMDDKLKIKPTNGNVSDIVKNVKQAFTSGVSGHQQKIKEDAKKAIEEAAKNCKCECGEHCNTGSKTPEECAKCDKPKCIVSQIVEFTLCALSSVAQQVREELDSLFLSPKDANIAGFLDDVYGKTNALHGQLTEATTPVQLPTPPTGQPESPAKAVDKTLEAVRDFVNGSGDNITEKFNNQVTRELTSAVGGLPGAVRNFNDAAEKQIKAAAQTAVGKAAEQIGDKNQDPDVKTKMPSFHQAHDKIKSELDKQLRLKVDQHIGEDDPPGGQTKFILAKDYFKTYNDHVDQKHIEDLKSGDTLKGIKSEGKLPAAMGDIKTQVFDVALNMIDPEAKVDEKDKITGTTFTGPFDEIKTQLDEIRKLVDGEDGMVLFDIAHMSKKGAKTLLTELSKLLTNPGSYTFTVDGSSYQTVQGLEAIYTKINELQTGTFNTKPGEIGTAVTAIRQQLEELRGKLKNEKDKKDDVIYALKYLRGFGFSSLKWKNGQNGVQGKDVYGLGKVHKDLKEQNAILPDQTKIIGEAMRQIRLELFRMGIKIQNIFNDDDILDKLRRLQYRIGQGKNIGLEAIKNTIQQLQEQPFKQKPIAIGDAKQEIVDELGKLQKELQGAKGNDVMETLKDLQNNGLSGEHGWNKNKQGNSKSLKNIEDALQGQQTTLSSQPTAIGGGVTQITDELQRLQKQLNAEVTEKLKKLKQHGLEKGATKWNEGNNINGLVKMKN